MDTTTNNEAITTLAEQLKGEYQTILSTESKRGKQLKALYQYCSDECGMGENEDGSLTGDEKTLVKDAIALLDKRTAMGLIAMDTTRVTKDVRLKAKWSGEHSFHFAGSITVRDQRKLSLIERMETALAVLRAFKGKSESRKRLISNDLCEAVNKYLETLLVSNGITGVSSVDWTSIARDSRARTCIDSFKYLFPHSGNVRDWLLPDERKALAIANMELRAKMNGEKPSLKLEKPIEYTPEIEKIKLTTDKELVNS